MDRKLGGLIFAAACVASPVAAQDAYQREYDRTIMLEAAKQGAIRARQEADAAELNLQSFSRLHSIWLQLGLPDDEARSVAATFQWDRQMDAIRARAAREGYASTMDAGLKAYRDYQYPLANQLILAAYLLPVEPRPAPTP